MSKGCICKECMDYKMLKQLYISNIELTANTLHCVLFFLPPRLKQNSLV